MINVLPKIRLFCDISMGTGHNNATRGLVQALETIGYTTETLHLVGACSVSFDYLRDPDWLSEYLYAPWPSDEDINLVHLNPGLTGDFWTANRKNIAYCAWETDALPKVRLTINGEERTVVGDLNKYDQVWVPSPFLVEIFKQSGVTVPIHVVPHALQRELLERPIKPVAKRSGTTFYTICSWNSRKDPMGLLRAYLTSGWGIMSPVRLTIHAVPHNRDLQSIQAHQIVAHETAKNLVASLASSAPPFGLMTTPKDYWKILDLHEAGHVFVSTSHGEGFGLPTVEALALGKVAIGGGPWLDPIDVPTLVKLPYKLIPITPMPECKGYELDQKWWAVEPSDVVRAMVAQTERSASDDERREAATKVRLQFSPEAIGQIAKPLLLASVGRFEAVPLPWPEGVG